jgi:hypothetical protein
MWLWDDLMLITGQGLPLVQFPAQLEPFLSLTPSIYQLIYLKTWSHHAEMWKSVSP